MALTTQPQPVTIAAPIGLTSAPVIHGVEKASSTYKKGAFLIDDDAGRLTPSTSPIDAGAVARRTVALAADDATGVTGADVLAYFTGPYTVFEGHLMELTAGLHTLVQADQFKVYPITQASVNWYLNADAVSDTGGGLVIGFKDPLGTVDGRVYFIVTSTARGGTNAGSGVF